MQSLKDKVVIITGASYGLGNVIAKRVAEEGAKLAIIARSQDKLQQTQNELESSGTVCKYYTCDLTDSDSITNAVNNIKEDFVQVDILINNAGIWYEGPTTEHPKEKITQLYKTNIIGLIEMCQEVIPTMQKQKSGQILNIASLAGIEPSADWGVYSGSKHAVRGFTDSLRLEVENMGIKVMGFYPPGMNTELFNKSGFEKSNEPWMTNVNDIAEIITFMLKQPSDVNMRHVEVGKFFGGND